MGKQLRELGIALSFFSGAVFLFSLLIVVVAPDLAAKLLALGVMAATVLLMYGAVSLRVNNREIPSTVHTDRACDACAQVRPTRWLEFKQSSAYVVARNERSISGQLCRACAEKISGDFNRANLTRGWWSLPGIIRTPLYVLENVANRRMARKLAAPAGPPSG